MRERLNLRLAAVLIGTALAVAVAVVLVHRWQVQRSAPGLLELAHRAESKGNAVRAQGLLAVYLDLNPSDTSAWFKYAEITEALAHDSKARLAAVVAYERVLEADGNRADVRRRLARIYAKEGWLKEAQGHLKNLIDHAGDAQLAADDAQLMGECQEHEQNLGDAEKSFGNAITFNPHYVPAYVRLADLLWRRAHDGQDSSASARRRDEADRVMLSAVSANPENDRARLARFQFLHATGSDTNTSPGWVFRLRALSDPDADLEAALQRAPKSVDVRLAAAGVAAARGNLTEARDHLTEVLQQADGKPTSDERVYIQLANVKVGLGEGEDALELLRKAALRLPNRLKLQVASVETALRLGHFADARAAIAALARKNYERERLLVLNAQVLFAEGDLKEARNVLLDNRHLLTTKNPVLAAQADVFLGRCYVALGESDAAQTQFERVLQTEPNHPDAVVGIVELLAAQGRYDEAVRRLSVLAAARGVSNRIRLMSLRLQTLNYLSIKASARDPGEVKRGADNLEKFRAEITKALPDLVELVLLQSQIDEAIGAPQAAIKRLEDKLNSPQNKRETREVSLALAQLLARNAQVKAAHQILDNLEKAPEKPTTDSVVARLKIIERPTDQNFDSCIESAKTLLAASGEPLSGRDRIRLETGLAEMYTRLQLPPAREWWLKVAAQQPRNLAPRITMFNLAVREKARAGMEEAVREIRAAEGGREQGPFAHYFEAYSAYLSELFTESKEPARERFKEALSHLNEATRLKPEWAAAFTLKGDIYRAENNKERAIQEYLKAVRFGEQRVGSVRRIVEFFSANGRLDEADALIKKLPVDSDPQIKKIAADLSLSHARLNEAVELADGYIDSQKSTNASDLYKDHMWRARILSIAGRNEKEVRGAFYDAISAPGAHGAPWVELIDWHVKASRPSEAREEFIEAGSRLKGVERARCLELLGETEEARDAYRAALAAQPNDGTVLRQVVAYYERTGALAEVVALLKKSLVADPPLTRAEDAVWVRRLLPIALVRQGDYGAFNEALRVADGSIAASGNDPEDTYVKVRILATRPEFRKQALRELQNLQKKLKDQPLSPDAQFLLARLLVETGAWTEGRTLLSKLAREGTVQKRSLLRFFVDRLVQYNDRDAEDWLFELIKVAKDEPDTIRLQIAMSIKQSKGNGNRARDLLDKWAQPAGNATPEMNLNRLRIVARLADEFSREAGAERALLPTAEDFYRRVAKSDEVKDKLALAGFLVRCGNFKEAFELCRAAEPKAGGEAVATALVTAAYVYTRSPLTSAQVDVLAAEVETLLKSTKPTAGTRKLAALMAARCGHYTEAAKVSKEIVDADPSNPDARAQLAYMMVLENRLAEAEVALKEAEKLGGMTAGLRDTRGMIYLKTKRIKEAIDDLQEATVQKPSASKYAHLATAYRADGRQKDADKAMDRARELQSDGSLLLPAERELVDALPKSK